ncbi:MAG TPA: hypothetical protein VL984_14765 [Acidimicrobiales bacterium]|nr:hypothetical protein [Acidimicrobiales bacterium]
MARPPAPILSSTVRKALSGPIAALAAGGLAVAACGHGPQSTGAATSVAVPPSRPPPPIFPKSLFWEGGVQDWPVDQGSAGYVADLEQDFEEHYGAVGVNTMPIYTVPAGQPEVPLSVRPGCGDFLASTGSEIPVPPYAALNGSSDNPLVIYQPSTGRDWELWQAARLPSGGYQACWGGRLKVATSSGVFPAPYGLSATGISYLATAVTQAELASGEIDHTLALEVPSCTGSVYPADRDDCQATSGQPPEGEWFRLPAGLRVPSGLSPFARMVFVALQRYGAVVTDQAGGVMIQAEQASDWYAEGHEGPSPMVAAWGGLPEFKVIAPLPWQDLQAVRPPEATASAATSQSLPR